MLKKISLSSFGLKIIAASLMLLDHIHYYFDFTGKIPLLFTQLGRLSMGLFMFLLVEGFFYTKNRKKYFLKIYLLASFMSLIRFVYSIFRLNRFSAASPMLNSVLSAFAVLLLTMQGFEFIKQKRYLVGACIVFAVVVLPYFFIELWSTNIFVYAISELFLFNHFTLLDGGTMVVLVGLALYFFRENRILQAIAYVLTSLAYCFYQLQVYCPGYSFQSLFTTNFQWLMVFAAPIFLLYNQKRGRKIKLAFYVFYPAHIYILYIISIIITFSTKLA